jgi:hypothetical protein
MTSPATAPFFESVSVGEVEADRQQYRSHT